MLSASLNKTFPSFLPSFIPPSFLIHTCHTGWLGGCLACGLVTYSKQQNTQQAVFAISKTKLTQTSLSQGSYFLVGRGGAKSLFFQVDFKTPFHLNYKMNHFKQYIEKRDGAVVLNLKGLWWYRVCYRNWGWVVG